MTAEFADARHAVRELLVRVRRAVPQSATDTLVQALCDGLRTIPVPFVGSFLASVVGNSVHGGGPDTEDVLRQLDAMTISDDAFAAGLEQLGANVQRLRDDLQEIRRTQVASAFRLTRFSVEQRWPIDDHQITGLLLDSGGGLVIVDEVFLEIERIEPILWTDLTVPAAPLREIHLKATLDGSSRTYPLFALNGEGSRQYEA